VNLPAVESTSVLPPAMLDEFRAIVVLLTIEVPMR